MASMATADELRAQISAQQQRREQAKARVERANQEISAAKERQKLRAELERVLGETRDVKEMESSFKRYREDIDSDRVWLASDSRRPAEVASTGAAGGVSKDRKHVQSRTDCGAAVVSGELEWDIRGFSWLKTALRQVCEKAAMSHSIVVGGHIFRLMYHPNKENMGFFDQRGSLVICHNGPPDDEDDEGVAFRYSISIKSKERGFIQWGDSGSVDEREDTDARIFGPDVCENPTIPTGIFGMSHTQLMNSEWIIDDVLTAKLRVDVRPDVEYEDVLKHEVDKDVGDIVVPSSTITDRLALLLESGAGSDLTFVVQGERIRAHSAIVSACSDVLQRLLACGMQESISKEIAIGDCEPQVFRMFLRYLYSDSFPCLESFIAGKNSEQSSGDASDSRSAAGDASTKISMLQQLLAVSHKYQVARLQLWCERELSKCIAIGDVCTVLCQAHLYEAKRLEKKCLDFILAHKNEVVRTDAFGSLSQAWPQVSLKIILHFGAIDESSAAVAIGKQQSGHKRKRDDQDE
eukprot:gnl/TRDRNA2_/TRDRNA2_177678_c4_seq12.p1 gnl/TRDRNA2_/TRDRNA2_177678_c4~~gnl/TRDRNA2_/TRDRNA2_177678_c4_seq12.p1  ORF type:complete len:522 (+),score=67.77 gnl/TRDRNA2_/TRDRNA2_177678_c4_seq12:75-1640(+)